MIPKVTTIVAVVVGVVVASTATRGDRTCRYPPRGGMWHGNDDCALEMNHRISAMWSKMDLELRDIAKICGSSAMVLLAPSPPLLPLQASSYPTPPSTSNHSFASPPIPTPAPSTYPSTPTLPFHQTSTTDAPTPPSVPILRSVACPQSLQSIILP